MKALERLTSIAREEDYLNPFSTTPKCESNISWLKRYCQKSKAFTRFIETTSKKNLIVLLQHPWDIAFDPDDWLKDVDEKDYKRVVVKPHQILFRKWVKGSYPKIINEEENLQKKEEPFSFDDKYILIDMPIDLPHFNIED